MARVLFLYRKRHENMGSKRMRVDQLIDIAGRHLGDRHELAQRHLPRWARQQRAMTGDVDGAVLVFLKGAIEHVERDLLEEWRGRAAALCVDHVDAALQPRDLSLADVHIAASRRGERELRRRLGAAGISRKVVHLRHHPDPRLDGDAAAGSAEPGRASYFGRSSNAVLTPRIAERVSVPDYDDAAVGELIEEMTRAPAHYCVRPRMRGGVRRAGISKPFTKGFNAAMAGAIAIVNRDVDDAEHYLGEDYPYFAESTEEPDVIEALDRYASGVGGPEWRLARSRMDELRARCRPARVARELNAVLGEVTG